MPDVSIVSQYPVMLAFLLTSILAVVLGLLVAGIVWAVFKETFLGVAEGRRGAKLRKGHKSLAAKGKDKLSGDYYD